MDNSHSVSKRKMQATRTGVFTETRVVRRNVIQSRTDALTTGGPLGDLRYLVLLHIVWLVHYPGFGSSGCRSSIQARSAIPSGVALLADRPQIPRTIARSSQTTSGGRATGGAFWLWRQPQRTVPSRQPRSHKQRQPRVDRFPERRPSVQRRAAKPAVQASERKVA